MKIGLVGPLPPPSGGMANQLLLLQQLLDADAIDVTVIQVNAPYVPSWMVHFKGIRALARLIPYLLSLWRASGSVDLLHVFACSGWSWFLFATPAIWIAKLRGTAVVLHYHGGEAESFFSRSFKWIKSTLMRADIVVVPSGFLASVFNQRNISCVVVPNVINLELFSQSPQCLMTWEEGRHPHVVVARNLEPIYDNATAIRAFRIIKNHFPTACMTIAGSGPELQSLLGLVSELELADSVRMIGRVDNARMPELFHCADVLINPSLADNMPVSILEALASRVPVVTTSVGGIPYLVVDGETALFVPPGEPEAMAQGVISVLSSSRLRSDLITNGQNLVQQYVWHQVKKKLHAVYERALEINRQSKQVTYKQE